MKTDTVIARVSMAIAVLIPLATATAAAAQASPEDQIEAAIRAAPEAYREGARVLGYDARGDLVTLRPGSNEMVCLGPDPSSERWSVACYHESLEPFMARGRALRAEGLEDVNAVRWPEVEEGSLELPYGATLYVLHGEEWDEESDRVVEPYLRWVIYTPFATAEETGLPLRPRAGGEPWLMFPGTAGSHIMITPPRPE